jgi:hypothetical protein
MDASSYIQNLGLDTLERDVTMEAMFETWKNIDIT